MQNVAEQMKIHAITTNIATGIGRSNTSRSENEFYNLSTVVFFFREIKQKVK